jgi:hypothetical protein
LTGEDNSHQLQLKGCRHFLLAPPDLIALQGEYLWRRHEPPHGKREPAVCGYSGWCGILNAALV